MYGLFECQGVQAQLFFFLFQIKNLSSVSSKPPTLVAHEQRWEDRQASNKAAHDDAHMGAEE